MWSTVASAFKIALSVLSPELMLFYASITASFVLFIFYFFDKNAPAIKFTDLKKSAINGLFNPFIYYLVLFEAYYLLPAQIAQPLNYTWPIVLTIFSSIVFKQKLKLNTWIGLGISFIGVIVISQVNILSSSFNFVGVALALGSSIIWSIYWILNMKDHRNNSLKLFLNFLWGSFFVFFYIKFQDISFIFPLKGLLASLYIGLFEMGITFFVWLKALELSSETAKISHLVYLSPFLSFVFISVILKENIEYTSVIGLLIIILGIISQKIIKA
jgi:drug/metabolite transporter (DMT)-like permease